MRLSDKTINSHGNSLPTSQECFRSGFPKALWCWWGERKTKHCQKGLWCGWADDAASCLGSSQPLVLQSEAWWTQPRCPWGTDGKSRKPPEPSAPAPCSWRFSSCSGALCGCIASVRPFLLFLKPLIPGPLLPPQSYPLAPLCGHFPELDFHMMLFK